VDGMVLEYSFDTAITLIEKIANREGIGAVLAEGWKGAIAQIGRGSEEYAIQIKGIDIEFDPRAAFGSETFSQCTRSRGGSPPIEAMAMTMRDGEVKTEQIQRWVTRRGIVPEEAMSRVFTGISGFHVGRYTKFLEDWFTTESCLGICARPFVGMFYVTPFLTEFYASATGIETSQEDILKFGERAWNVVRAINAREGFGRRDDRMPERLLNEPLKFGDKEYVLSDYPRTHRVTAEEFESLLDDYYEERGWNKATGIPTGPKLLELGLGEVAQGLRQQGLIQ